MEKCTSTTRSTVKRCGSSSSASASSHFPTLVLNKYKEYLTKNVKNILKERVEKPKNEAANPLEDKTYRDCIFSCNHQWHLNMHKAEWQKAADELRKSGIVRTTPSSLSNFEALFDFLATEFKDTRYIGGQTCYDTALCVGAFYAKIIEPEKYVYIMSSPVIIAFRELIKHKMIPNTRIKKLMPRPQGDVPYIVCEYHVLMTFLDDLYNKN